MDALFEIFTQPENPVSSQGLDPLPIDPLLPGIVEHLRRHPALVITASPGAGKTTRVPRALLEAGFAKDGDILVVEPRRLATRLAATRVADELGEKPGGTVGYAVRFEKAEGPKTRVRFITEGVLSRKIIQNQELRGVSTIILDEFHERRLVTDFALAFLRRLQEKVRALKLVVMSATLDADRIASLLSAPIVRGEGSPFEVAITYEERADSMPLHDKVARAVARLLRSGLDGHILVFLPGSYEIRRAAEALGPLAGLAGIPILPLHGDLPAAEQARAVADSAERKIILATNVAETSITVPGVAAVVDSGLARMAAYSAWSGLPTLSIEKVSRASADQRAGRAGRTRSGRVLRLFTRADFDARPECTPPEIRRADLTESLLTLHGAGISDPTVLPWLEPPPKPALEAAEELLSRLGALDDSRRLTETGRRMLLFPVHPRLARMIVEGERLGIPEDCCVAAALLSERDIRLESRSRLGPVSHQRFFRAGGRSDLVELLDLFREAERIRFERKSVLDLGLDPRALETADRARQQLARLVTRPKQPTARAEPVVDPEEALLIAALSAFPDRVARSRSAGSREILLSTGGSAVLSGASIVHNARLLVILDAEERKGSKGSAATLGVLVRLASSIEPEWLAALFPDRIVQATSLVWNDEAGRVEEHRRTCYDKLVLEEEQRTAPQSEEVARLLAEAVMSRGLGVFRDAQGVPALRERLDLLARSFPGEPLPVLSGSELRAAVESLCSGRRSIAEVKDLSLSDALIARLTASQRDLLFREAPERVDLARRKKVRIHYVAGQSPWIESRLQDFIGMTSVPTICRGRIPLTVHLLAPNGRAVQVTRDLYGFWERHYPALRRELQRRYPKHHWPDPEDVAESGTSSPQGRRPPGEDRKILHRKGKR